MPECLLPAPHAGATQVHGLHQFLDRLFLHTGRGFKLGEVHHGDAFRVSFEYSTVNRKVGAEPRTKLYPS